MQSCRQVCLAAVVVGHRAAELFETLFDRAQRRLVQHERLAHRARDRVFGEIVDGRAETAGGDGAVGAFEHVLQHRGEPVGVVADGVLRIDVHAVIGERVRDVNAVGVDQVTEQNLGPDRHDLD